MYTWTPPQSLPPWLRGKACCRLEICRQKPTEKEKRLLVSGHVGWLVYTFQVVSYGSGLHTCSQESPAWLVLLSACRGVMGHEIDLRQANSAKPVALISEDPSFCSRGALCTVDDSGRWHGCIDVQLVCRSGLLIHHLSNIITS